MNSQSKFISTECKSAVNTITVNAMTVDVEDYFPGLCIRTIHRQSRLGPDSLPHRGEHGENSPAVRG